MSVAFQRRFDVDEFGTTSGQVAAFSMTEDELDFDQRARDVPLHMSAPVGNIFFYGGGFQWRSRFHLAATRFLSTYGWQTGLRLAELADLPDYGLSAAAIALEEDIERRLRREFVEIPPPARVIAKKQLRIRTAELPRWQPEIVIDRRTLNASRE